MLPISRKISRDEFPAHNTPAIDWRGEVLRIRIIKKPSIKSKLAIILSKKLYNTKPCRNLFKRRVFSLISQHLHKLDTNPHGYFVIFPLIHTQKITFFSIKNDINNFISSITK